MTNIETRVILVTMLTNVTTITIGIVLTVVSTTMITIRKAKLAAINVRRSSKYIKKKFFLSVTEFESCNKF